MDLRLTKDDLKCALMKLGQVCVRDHLDIMKGELPVHNLDIRDIMVYCISINLRYI